ncbi:MAG: D-aminoacyl-tRNA deacylase, partial [Anaerolineales bacterium]|nr:D-aminoacyl-tRNA deacylase [Anaerolineales bacterium]
MKALLQRVSYASVTVAGEVVGEIGRGFAILLGVTHSDGEAEAAWLAQKVAGIR